MIIIANLAENRLVANWAKKGAKKTTLGDNMSVKATVGE